MSWDEFVMLIVQEAVHQYAHTTHLRRLLCLVDWPAEDDHPDSHTWFIRVGSAAGLAASCCCCCFHSCCCLGPMLCEVPGSSRKKAGREVLPDDLPGWL